MPPSSLQQPWLPSESQQPWLPPDSQRQLHVTDEDGSSSVTVSLGGPPPQPASMRAPLQQAGLYEPGRGGSTQGEEYQGDFSYSLQEREVAVSDLPSDLQASALF